MSFPYPDECCLHDSKDEIYFQKYTESLFMSDLRSSLKLYNRVLKFYQNLFFLVYQITEYALKNPSSSTFELVQESDDFSDVQVAPNPYLDWQYVEGESQSNPHKILEVLIAAEDFDLARHWAEVHGVYDIVRQVS